MKTSFFDYFLPENLIAQLPQEPRDSSRLMIINRQKKTIEHKIFKDLPSLLKKGDLLVLNNTRVLPARLKGYKKETGGKVELLLLAKVDKNKWEVLAKPARRLPKGTLLIFKKDYLEALIKESLADGKKIVEFITKEPFEKVLQSLGEVPLPPYIKIPLIDKERYQTIYAKKAESVAAPTAGLHFTEELIKKIKRKGVDFATITLKVGLDTFRPVTEDKIEDHKIHSEHYQVKQEAFKKIAEAKRERRRIIAVGTTSARVLETIAPKIIKKTAFAEFKGETNLFIYPGYKFKLADGMITNFHLPRSTLLMMVAAFCGQEFILRTYREAIKKGYRFFSFGDAMFIQ